MNPSKFSLSEKDIDSIITTMIRLKAEHTQRHGKAPVGFVIGPVEWYAFRLSARVNKSMAKEVLPSLTGISIYVKTTPGVDLLIHPDDAGQFVGNEG